MNPLMHRLGPAFLVVALAFATGACSSDGEGTGEPSGPVSDIQLADLTDAGATEPADTADVAVDPGNVTDLEPASDVEAEVPDSGEDAGETTEEQDEGGEEPDLWTNTCPTPPKGLVDFHGDEFDALLERLWNDFWDPSGNWEEDMMGDATWFAPEVLFPVAAAGHCREPHDRAVQTVDHEVELLKQFLVDGTVSQDAVIGAPSLIVGYRWTHKHFYEATAGMGIRFIGGQIVSDPESFAGMFVSPVVALGATAYEIFDYVDATGKQDMVDLGMEVLGKARADYWDEEQGVYSDEAMGIWDWSEAMMLMALARAYKVTGDADLLEHAERLAASTKELLWDEGKGGFFAYPEFAGKGLSGLAFLTRAFLLLYEITGDQEHRDTAAATLDYCFSSELYDGDLLYHDWTEAHGIAGSYCTGCNFFVLANLWLYQELSSAPDQ